MPIHSGYDQLGEPTYQYLKSSTEEDSVLKVYSYKHVLWKTLWYHSVAVLCLGLPYAFFSWYPFLRVCRYKKCPLHVAELLFVHDTQGTSVIPVDVSSNVRYFIYHQTKFVWHGPDDAFVAVDETVAPPSLQQALDETDGLSEDEHRRLKALYGPNDIEIEVKSYWRLFLEEVFNPFYVFQAFSVALWFCDDYMVYAGCIVFITLVSSVMTLLETRRQSEALRDIARTHQEMNVVVKRMSDDYGPVLVRVGTSDLVPGDILVVPREGFTMPCDAILLNGHCIVNESMLTGESVPVMITPPSPNNETYNPKDHKMHTLSSGTEITQSRYYNGEPVLARVTRTGFNTTRGMLLKSIMFPAPIGNKFYRDSMKFVLVLFFIAASGMGYCLYLYIVRKAHLRDIIIRTLDIVTIVVPPALPAAMAAGIVYSQNRLKRLSIFCISPPRIVVAGKVKLACFDKTGTLTQDGLDMYSVLPVENAQFKDAANDVTTLDNKSPFVQSMATCHTLTRIKGIINGDPLDLTMFESTGWVLEEPVEEDSNFDILAPTVVRPKQEFASLSNLHDAAGGDMEVPYQIGIIHQFQFSSTLQRMSVICSLLGSQNLTVYSKGAPERIVSMCTEESVPTDFNVHLNQFTAQGFRVIALAFKQLPATFKWKDAQKVKREIIECDLTFLGFIVLQNTLKRETAPIINILQTADIRTVMITGDYVMTAISVARDCGMVKIDDDVLLLNAEDTDEDCLPRIYLEQIGGMNRTGDAVIRFDTGDYHFAMDGKTWAAIRKYYPDILPYLLLRSTIFARFKPNHKTQVINALQELDYVISMVGDGANDCGALKAAHIGISLSKAEASVAAPFTSSVGNISCLIDLILEGRCALVTSFATFKYMALYSLIQFITVILLYQRYSTLGDQQFLFIDLVLTTVLALTIGRQGSSNNLVRKRPIGSLTSSSVVVPLILQILLCIAVQYGALYYLTQQEWFEPNKQEEEEVILCWENTVLFVVSSFQYVILAVVYSKGRPYRQGPLTNLLLLISSLSFISFLTYLCIDPPKILCDFFEIEYLRSNDDGPERRFRESLLLFPIVHMIVALCIEVVIAERKWLRAMMHFVCCKRRPKNRFKRLLQQHFDLESWFHEEDGRRVMNVPPIN